MAKASLTGIAGWIFAVAAVTCGSGCISMGSVSNSLSDLLVPGGAAPEPVTGPSISVIVKKQEGTARVVELRLTENMLVNDALKQSGAYREFRRPKIRLVRKDPQGRGEHALGVDFDRSQGRIPETSNYVLWEGDRLIIEGDDVGGELVDSLLGPMGRLIKQR